jgi:hypothetical protein
VVSNVGTWMHNVGAAWLMPSLTASPTMIALVQAATSLLVFLVGLLAGALAEGLGIRTVARVFEIDPTTMLAWLVQVADHAAAFSRHCLHDLRVRQVQCDELFALLSAVQFGEVSFRLEQWAVCHLSHAVGCVHMRWRTG